MTRRSPAAQAATITGLLLAGGLGRRMGGVDKGLVALDGVTMASRVLERLRPQVGTVLINAGDSMQRVTTARNAGFSRNVLVGFLAQIAMLPILLTICLMLALTLLGILLIPFAIVAYVIAVLGLLVLGGLGAVQMVGRGAAARRPGLSERGARLQSLVSGMLLLSIPWLAAAAVASWPITAAWVRTLALGITWVAVTAGLGAALRTRGGTRSHDEPWGIRRPAPSGTPLPVATPQAEWLTPTPLTGVVAVKRPTVTTGGSR